MKVIITEQKGEAVITTRLEKEYIYPNAYAFTVLYQNGVRFQTMVYDELQHDDDDPSDRIHLLITDGDGVRKGWLMNVEDALTIMRALTAAIGVLLDKGYPLTPRDK